MASSCMTRRAFLRTVGLGLGAAAVGSGCAPVEQRDEAAGAPAGAESGARAPGSAADEAAAGKQAKPAGAGLRRGRHNVLLICVDDLRPQLGCFGCDFMVTPNIDRLADEGRLFTHHYVQSAVCGPSRCSMLTGQPQHSWDCWKKARSLKAEPERPVSVAHLFRRAGYRTVCIGKVSHQPGGVMDPEQTVHQVPFSWDKAFAPVGPWRTPWRAFFSYAGGKAYNKVIRMEKDEPRLPYECTDVPDTGYADGLNAEAAVAELRSLAEGDAPFFLAVGFYKPHLPFNAPKKHWDLYNPDTIALAENAFPPKHVDAAVSLHRSFELTTHYDWPAGEGNVPEEKARLLRHAYYACTSYVDAQIGTVLDEARRLGLMDRTVVCLWSDHGWHLGEHGMWGKQTNFEVAVRSPLILAAPGLQDRGRRAHGLVETVDLVPTLADLCGLAPPDGLAGTSLVPLLENADGPGKAEACSFHPRGNLMGRTLRTLRYRLVHWTNRKGETAQVELYDHAIDPDENTNVAGRYPKLVDRLLAQLKRRSGEG